MKTALIQLPATVEDYRRESRSAIDIPRNLSDVRVCRTNPDKVISALASHVTGFNNIFTDPFVFESEFRFIGVKLEFTCGSSSRPYYVLTAKGKGTCWERAFNTPLYGISRADKIDRLFIREVLQRIHDGDPVCVSLPASPQTDAYANARGYTLHTPLEIAWQCSDELRQLRAAHTKECGDALVAFAKANGYAPTGHKAVSVISCPTTVAVQTPEFYLTPLSTNGKIAKGRIRRLTRAQAEELCCSHPTFLGYLTQLRRRTRSSFQVASGTISRITKVDGQGNTPLERSWRLHEQNYQLTPDDQVLGGPRKMLTLAQYARASHYDRTTGISRL